jgi:hypothetical protein
MAISTDSVIEFYGTQDSLANTTSAVNNGAFSDGTNDLSSWTNDDDAPMAAFVFTGTYSVAPTANTTVDLYAALQNITSTNDQQAPDANFQHTYIGSFPLNDNTSAQYIAIRAALPNTATSQVYNFYIYNDAGQQLGASWDLQVTPISYGPHP